MSTVQNVNEETDYSKLRPSYEPTIPLFSDIDINDEKNCPAMYKQSWSDTLYDIVNNFLRKNDILKDCNQIIPKSMYEIIISFYINDITKNKSFKDYMNAVLICKYFSVLKQTPRADLKNPNDLEVKKKYKLVKKGAWTSKKIFNALKDYNAKEFEINVSDFEILFVDHNLSKNNLGLFSFPKDVNYNLSKQEAHIIAAIRDTIKINEKPVIIERVHHGHKVEYPLVFQSNELLEILKKGNFKSGKTSIRLHTIVECRDKAIFALDYTHTFVYFLFVFKYFTIIIHDKATAERHTTRTMQAKTIAGRYRGILGQLDKSGL
eukprot:162811_1